MGMIMWFENLLGIAMAVIEKGVVFSCWRIRSKLRWLVSRFGRRWSGL
jgi:hypothetical protein